MKPVRLAVLENPATRRLVLVLGVGIGLWILLALLRAVRQDRLSGIEFPRVDTAAVDTVVLARIGDSALLVRGAGGRWTANGFRADTARIRELLRALVDTTMWSEQSAASKESHARLGVDTYKGRRIRVVTGARTAIDVVAGNRTGDYGGVFVRRPDGDAVFAVHSADFASVATRDADEWRDKRIATVTPDSVGSVVLRRGARTVTLRRSGTSWTMDGVATDSSAVASLLEAYRDLNAMGFATKAQADSVKLASPRYTVALRSRSGARLLDLALDSIASGIYVRADTTGVIYRLDTWQGPRLVPADTALRRKAKK